MEQHGTERLKKMLDDFCNQLNKMVDEKKLEPWERGNLLRHTQKVLSKRTKKYDMVKKEAEKIMGGRLIKTDIDIAMEKVAKETTEKVMRETTEEVQVNNIRSLIETGKFDVNTAMETLKIPMDQQGTYIKLLEQSDIQYNPDA